MKTKAKNGNATNGKYHLQLYVSGMSNKSALAIKNITAICNDCLKDANLEIIDLYKNPELASKNQVVFSPSLIKTFPPPRKILIGTFSDIDKVKSALGIE